MRETVQNRRQRLWENVRIEEKNGCWQIQGSFVLEEPAATGQNISQEKLLNMEQEEESELPDERNRNDN